MRQPQPFALGLLMGPAFCADGKPLASASADRTINLWDLAPNKERFTLTGHADPLSSVAFSPDGKTVATAARDHTVRLWDVSAVSAPPASPAP